MRVLKLFPNDTRSGSFNGIAMGYLPRRRGRGRPQANSFARVPHGDWNRRGTTGTLASIATIAKTTTIAPPTSATVLPSGKLAPRTQSQAATTVDKIAN